VMTMTRAEIMNSLTMHPHDFALRDPNRMLERIDVVKFANEHADALEKEAKELGFCQYARDLRVKARGIREFVSGLLAGEHVQFLRNSA